MLSSTEIPGKPAFFFLKGKREEEWTWGRDEVVVVWGGGDDTERSKGRGN